MLDIVILDSLQYFKKLLKRLKKENFDAAVILVLKVVVVKVKIVKKEKKRKILSDGPGENDSLRRKKQ